MNASDRAKKLDWILEKMWADYSALSPRAAEIARGLAAKGETVRNDHIALRTFRHPRLGIDRLAAPFENLGYRRVRDYTFTEKKLHAWHFENEDPNRPKIFISELLLEKVSRSAKEVLSRKIESISEADLMRDDFAVLGRPWEISTDEYLGLAEESEYAGWVAAFGFRPNHFTIDVNSMRHFRTLADVNAYVKSLGIPLNESGGVIKGSPADLLEQSSTLAEPVSIRFSDRELRIPGCYYEFAFRYSGADGKIYQGFVAASADKIFESTDRIFDR